MLYNCFDKAYNHPQNGKYAISQNINTRLYYKGVARAGGNFAQEMKYAEFSGPERTDRKEKLKSGRQKAKSR